MPSFGRLLSVLPALDRVRRPASLVRIIHRPPWRALRWLWQIEWEIHAPTLVAPGGLATCRQMILTGWSCITSLLNENELAGPDALKIGAATELVVDGCICATRAAVPFRIPALHFLSHVLNLDLAARESHRACYVAEVNRGRRRAEP